ncbi:MauE/DoxX family redox-associated membrane protein [Streptomyces rubrogriseus]|uniref:MauE/DoxX family redox-associated membrane protein n=1 Tax=Streptomyces rubrogriseus TaxID=194673 RepID=UPI000D5988F6|nr:MauE/DoxX family redox-associated membrane protein [Streptomyces rubrogriseus]
MLEALIEVGRGAFTALFAVAAVSKLRAPAFADLSASLAALGPTGTRFGRFCAATLIVAEATVATVLLLGPASAGLGLAALLLAVLAGGVLMSTRRQLGLRCACFGTARETLGSRHLWRNTTLSALALFLALAPTGPTLPGTAERVLLTATGAGIGIAVVLHEAVAAALTPRKR